jgi:hypothetical protein
MPDVSGVRLVVGFVVMGIAVPLTLFLLLGLHSTPQLLTIAATTFFTWGVSDVLAKILEKPRLSDRSPGKAVREGWESRAKGDASS